jgi:hypothetical protein
VSGKGEPRSAGELMVSVSTSAKGIVPASLMWVKNSPRLKCVSALCYQAPTARCLSRVKAPGFPKGDSRKGGGRPSNNGKAYRSWRLRSPVRHKSAVAASGTGLGKANRSKRHEPW